MFTYPRTSENCYLRVIYESQELKTVSLVFRAYFGKQQALLQTMQASTTLPTQQQPSGNRSDGGLEFFEHPNVVNKTKSEKLKRQMLIARV
jgi:hypothetical protein